MVSRLDIIRYYLGRLGRVGAAGTVLILGSLVFLFAVVQPKTKALAELMSRNAQVFQAESAKKASSKHQANAQPQLPPLAPEAATALQHLYDAADKAGLELVQGEYRLVEVKDARQTRYQLMLPVYGPYPAVRSFLTHALNQEQALAISAIQMRRDVIESTELETLLNFTLFLEGMP